MIRFFRRWGRCKIGPHFISVTASNNKFDIEIITVRWLNFISNDLWDSDDCPFASCLSNQGMVSNILQAWIVLVNQIWLLRGDIFPDVAPKDFRYATDLIEYVTLDIIGACYPEGHPDSPTRSLFKISRKRLMRAALFLPAFINNVSMISKIRVPLVRIKIWFMQVTILNRNQSAFCLLKTCGEYSSSCAASPRPWWVWTWFRILADSWLQLFHAVDHQSIWRPMM